MKRHKKAIPIAFNMSLGLIPVILCMILTEFMENRYALSIGTVIGILFSWISYSISHKKIHNFILYISTFTLAVLTGLSFIFTNFLSSNFIASIMAIVTLVVTGFFFYGQGMIKRILLKVHNPSKADLIKKSFDSSLVSARLIFIVAVLHLLVLCSALIFSSPLSVKGSFIIYYILPIVFFILVIGINQVGIYLAGRLTKDEVEIPIVNEQGDVIGKRYKIEAYRYKNQYINPVIRIAYIQNGLLFLCDRPQNSIVDPDKADIPLETYLEFEETLEQGVNRIIHKAYGKEIDLQPRFTLKYQFKNEETNRLNYLYIAYIKDEDLLRTPNFVNGKLWTLTQIEQNLGMNYFSQIFEYEYDFLKETVKIWEEFK